MTGVDPESVDTIVSRSDTIGTVVVLLYYGSIVGVFALVTVVGNVLLGILAALAYFLLASVPAFEYEAELLLSTDRLPAEVEDDFAAVCNPFTVDLWTDTTGPEQPGDDDLHVQLTVSQFAMIEHTYTIEATEPDDGAVDIVVETPNGDRLESHVRIHDEEGWRTRVGVRSVRSPVSPIMVVLMAVQDQPQRTLLSRLGYDVVEESGGLGLRV